MRTERGGGGSRDRERDRQTDRERERWRTKERRRVGMKRESVERGGLGRKAGGGRERS